jgi:DNA-binding CsgD family transcriptional regulator
MPTSRSVSALIALGVAPEEEQLYHRLVPLSGQPIAGAAGLLQMDREELVRSAARLADLGLVCFDGDRLEVPTLADALCELVRRESQLAATAAARLDVLAGAVPQLVAAAARPEDGQVTQAQPLDGELSAGGDAIHLLRDLLRNSGGDMLWLRPDTWSIRPREEAVNTFLSREIAAGRRSRAIYPVRALTVDPEALRRRARAGEEVRVISDVPTRMFILGDAHAVLPEPLGFSDNPRIHVRQRSLVTALTHWFEALWDRARPVPGLDTAEPRPDLRRFLLEQLMAGATDEVIARRLGLGLRTVRRRIAALMVEVGADTRFQLGAEASRRGWL